MPEAKKQNRLLDIQRIFFHHIFDEGDTKILNLLPYSSQESLARLNIYRNNIFGGTSSVLYSIFEATKKVIGEDRFEELSQSYAKKHHSKSGNLNDYGVEFPQFIAKESLPFISDLSRLEWYYHICYYAKDVPDFDVEVLQKLSQEKLPNLKFKLHPSCYLLESEFGIFSFWKGLIDGKKRKKLPSKDREFLLVERASGARNIRQLNREEFLFLDNIQKQKTLYETYEVIRRKMKRDVDVGKIMQNFISLRILL